MFPVTIIHQKAQTLGLDYLVIGGHAINAYCEPRATLDVDFVIRKRDRPRWCALLFAEGFKLKHEAENFTQFSPPRKRCMLNSSEDAHMPNNDDKLKEPAGTDGLELPIAPAWFSEPPKGSIEDGIHLSLLAIEQIGDPSEIFAERDRRMCDVEFTL